METLIAFHGKKEIKEKYLARIKKHRRLNHLTQGVGWESNGITRGCAIGCTLEKYDHKAYETELGIPEMIAKLEDCIFEGLPRKKAIEWPERFLKAIPVGKDLSMIGTRFLIEINHRNLSKLDKKWKQELSKPIMQVIDVLKDWLEIGKPNGSAALNAAGAVRSAARSAAMSAESAAWSSDSAAWSAESAAMSAESAAKSAAWSAESAAWSSDSAAGAAKSAAWSAQDAARSAASAERSAAKNSEYEWMADKLIELLKEK